MKYLPVVDEVCERDFVGGVWDECTINFIGDLTCVYSTDMEREVQRALKDVKFRPIKADRKKFMKAAADVGSARGSLTFTQERLAGRMYDSGLFQLKDNQDD
jgi:hypothetical protein